MIKQDYPVHFECPNLLDTDKMNAGLSGPLGW